jgi:hypothetical protein
MTQLALGEPTSVPLDKFKLSRFSETNRVIRELW